MAQSHEKLGERQQALTYYKKYYDGTRTLFGENSQLTLQAKLDYNSFIDNVSEKLTAQNTDQQKAIAQQINFTAVSEIKIQHNYWLDKTNIEDNSLITQLNQKKITLVWYS